MNDTIVIIGAGGHGRVCGEIAELSGYKNVLFLDDSNKPGVNVVGKSADFVRFINNSDFFVGVGDNKTRNFLIEKILNSGGNIATLIHPDSTLSRSASVGVGSVIMAGAVVNAGAKIGKGVIINTCSSVDHDCDLGDCAHISVGAHLAGTVSVGKCTFIGAGATLINNISVCDNCMVGAGAVMINSVFLEGVYVGVPARKIK